MFKSQLRGTSIFANVWSQIKQIMRFFNPPEVVDRGSETQLQVGEKYVFNMAL